MLLLAAESENRQLEDLPQLYWFWLCTWKISSVGEEKVNNWEFCILKITLMIQGFFFILSLSVNALHDFYSGIVDPFIFIRK